MGFGKQLLEGLGKGAVSLATSIPGAAAGFGISTLNGLVGNYFERKSLDYQAQLNEQSAENAYKRQLDFWNKQNAYNDPSSQIARLRAAGLNPAMINGNSVNNTAGALSSAPQASPGSPNGNKPDAMSSASALASYAYQVKQMGFLDAQTQEAMERILSIQVERGIKYLESELKLTESEKATLDYEAFYEALYDRAVDGGSPRIKNNKYTEEIREARSRIATNEAEKVYKEAQTSYTKAMEQFEANRDSREAFLALEDAALKRAQASAQRAQAGYYSTQSEVAKNQDLRASEAHAVQMEINDYLKSIKATEDAIKKVELFIADLWTMPVKELEQKYGLKPGQSRITRLRSFIHDNVRLGGVASWKGKE